MSVNTNVNPNLNEIEITIESVFPLAGTLAIPPNTTQPAPAILIISGSGENDRNGNGMGLNVNIYKLLAEELGKMGFVTLRYDKRGTHASSGKFHETGLSDLAEDSASCIRFLKSRPEVDPQRIVILGHSEGASIAPIVQTREPVDGLILVAGAFENLIYNTIPRQTTQAMEELEKTRGIKGFLFRFLKVKKKAKKQSDAFLEKVLTSPTPSIRYKGKKISAKWFQEHANLNITEYLNKVTCPVLAVTGSNEFHVLPEHAKKFAEAVKGEAEWHITPHMNHILRKYDKPHTALGLKKEYTRLAAAPIDETLIELINHWLHKHIVK